MKTLSKRKKLEILRKMLKLVSAKTWQVNDGLCLAFLEVTNCYLHIHGGLAALGISHSNRQYWRSDGVGPYHWSLTKVGLASRIKAIRSAIKRLTAKKKKVK